MILLPSSAKLSSLEVEFTRAAHCYATQIITKIKISGRITNSVNSQILKKCPY
jgi:hypothetical protein